MVYMDDVWSGRKWSVATDEVIKRGMGGGGGRGAIRSGHGCSGVADKIVSSSRESTAFGSKIIQACEFGPLIQGNVIAKRMLEAFATAELDIATSRITEGVPVLCS